MEDPPSRRRSPAVLHDWIDRVAVPRGRLGSWLSIGGVCLGFGVCYGLTGLFGVESVTPTWYTPLILVSAARFRYRGALVASAAATLLTGPLWPVPEGGLPQRSTVWMGRGLVFLFVGLATAALIDRILAGRKRELELSEQERDLAVRQAAVIATVSHEFRTPLTVITGVARTLEVHRMVSGEGRSLLSGLMEAAARLTDLVNTVGAVLDGSGDETFVRLEPVGLGEIMEHVLDHLGVRDPRRRVSLQLDASVQSFISDRELLSQLLRHVIENAVKFSPSDEQVEVRALRERGRLEVRIADRGPGIDGSLLRSPLPFTQGDPSLTRTAQGLGLGLFAASRLAAVLAGTIRFETRLGGGTEVVVDVAAPDTSHAPADGAPRSATA
jgi:signal transduction histidine kinase